MCIHSELIYNELLEMVGLILIYFQHIVRLFSVAPSIDKIRIFGDFIA